MKKDISVITTKIVPLCLFLVVCFTMYSTETVRKLPLQYYVSKKITSPLPKKSSEEVRKHYIKTFTIKSHDDSLIEVPQNILELSNTIKSMLEDLEYSYKTPIPLPYSRKILDLIFNDILPQYNTNTNNSGAYLENIGEKLTLEELIDITNALNYLDIHSLENSKNTAPILSMFITKVFDTVIHLTPQEVIENTNILKELTSDIQKKIADVYVIPLLQKKMIKLDRKNAITLSTESFDCIAISPDGKTIVAGGMDNRLEVWDISNHKKITDLKGHDSYVEAITFNREGTLIASADQKGNLILWNAQTYQEEKRIKQNNAIYTLAFNSDGTQIIVGGLFQALQVFDTTTLEYITSILPSTRSISLAAYSPDGKHFISGDSRTPDTLTAWNAADYQEYTILNNTANIVKAIAFSPDGKQFFSAGSNRSGLRVAGNIVRWSTEMYKELGMIETQGEVQTIALSPNNDFLAYGTFEKIMILDSQTSKEITHLKIPNEEDRMGYSKNSFSQITFSQDSKQLISSGESTGLIIWNLLTQDDIQTSNNLKQTDLAHPLMIKLLIIYKLCSALNNNRTVRLTNEESAIFNDLLAPQIKDLLADGIDTSPQTPSTITPSTSLAQKITKLNNNRTVKLTNEESATFNDLLRVPQIKDLLADGIDTSPQTPSTITPSTGLAQKITELKNWFLRWLIGKT